MNISNIIQMVEKRIIDIVSAIIFAIIVGIILLIEPNIYNMIIYGTGSIIIISVFGILIHKNSSLRDENTNMKNEDIGIRDDLLSIRDENNRMREKINLFENKERELNKIEIIYNENITNYEGMVVIIRFDEPILYTEASLPYLEFKYYIINRGVFDINVEIRLLIEESSNQYQLGEKLSDKINIPRQTYGSTNIRIQPISQDFIDELSRKGNIQLRINSRAHISGYREFYVPSPNSFRLDSITLFSNDKIQNKLFRDFKEKIHIDDIRRILPNSTNIDDRLDCIIFDINRYHENVTIIPLFEDSIHTMIGLSNFWFRKYSIYNRRRIVDEEFINLLCELSFIIDTYIKICVFAMENDRIKSGVDCPRRDRFKIIKEFYETFGKNYNQFIVEINRKIPQTEIIPTINLVIPII